MSRKLDIVTVTYGKEAGLLRLQARSLAKYVDPKLVGNIHIIINEKWPSAFKRMFEENIRAEYGVLSAKLRIHTYREITGRRLKKIGWRSQQILKLMISQMIGTDEYLVLDCKIHYIRPVSRDHIYTGDGKLRTHQYRVVEHFTRQFEKALKFLEVPQPENLDDALPTVPPVLFKTQLVKELIANIETKGRGNFPEIFMKEGFTEFYLYLAYLLKRFSGTEEFYEKVDRQTIPILASKADKPDEIKALLARLDDEGMKSLGVHREVIEATRENNRKVIADTWLKFDLISSLEEADDFWEETLSPPKKRFFIF